MANNDGRGSNQPAVDAIAKVERDMKGAIGLTKRLFRGLLDEVNRVSPDDAQVEAKVERKAIPERVAPQHIGTITVIPNKRSITTRK